jgi:arylsulfatase A-like enzyme
MIVTADHGEFFGEYGMYGHQLMPLEATTRVPLISVGLPSDISDKSLVQHIDIMDTALRALDEPFEQSQGNDLTDQKRDSVLTEWFSSVELFESNNPDFNNEGKFLRGHSRCLKKDGYRYMTDGNEILTFVNDMKDELSEDVIESMSDDLEQYKSKFEREQEIAFHTSNDAETRLRDLGYLG